jgi:hypothetical protein
MGYDINIARGTISPIGRYPNVQATRDGWMYLHDQVFPLWWSYRYVRREDFESYLEDDPNFEMSECPHYITPFPIAEYSVPYDYKRAGERLDVYYSYSAIDPDTHSMLVWSLDYLAKSTKDFFVPMYQNIIDPNLTAVKLGEEDQNQEEESESESEEGKEDDEQEEDEEESAQEEEEADSVSMDVEEEEELVEEEEEEDDQASPMDVEDEQEDVPDSPEPESKERWQWTATNFMIEE